VQGVDEVKEVKEVKENEEEHRLKPVPHKNGTDRFTCAC